MKAVAISISLVLLLGGISVYSSYSISSENIYRFKGGIRIPAGAGTFFSDFPGTIINSINGGLIVYNPKNKIKSRCIYQLPVPESAKVRQFVLVGNVTVGEIFAYIGAIEWNKPHQGTIFAPLSISPNTPYEIASEKQKKVTTDLPLSGSSSLIIDRSKTYFIEVEFKSDSPVDLNKALELFYIEIYWD
jgi:hypothetical protein